MAKFNMSLPTILILAAVVWLVAFDGVATVQDWFAAAPPAPAETGGIDSAGVTCPDDLSTTYDGDVVNSLDTSTTSYIPAVGRFIPGGNFNQYTAFTAGTSAKGGTGVDLKCGESYMYYLLPTQDAELNPIAPVDFSVVQGADASRVIQATNFSILKAKAYDNELRANTYNSGDLSAAGVLTNLAATIKSTTNTTWDIDVGESIDADLTVQTIATLSYFGNSDRGVYIAIGGTDYATQWDKPSVSIGGVSLVDVKNTGEISADDLAVLNTYAYIFKVPSSVDLGSTPSIVKLYVPAKAGQDPDDDLVVRFVAKAHYVDNDGYTIREDIFNRNSGSEILTATAQTVTFDVEAD